MIVAETGAAAPNKSVRPEKAVRREASFVAVAMLLEGYAPSPSRPRAPNMIPEARRLKSRRRRPSQNAARWKKSNLHRELFALTGCAQFSRLVLYHWISITKRPQIDAAGRRFYLAL